jgi:gluconokinase
LEGVCYALNDVLLAVESGSDGIDQINVSGGFVHSQTWMQLLSDICGKRLSLLNVEDASAMGAAFLGMKAVGLNDGKYPECSKQSNQHSVQPDMTKHKAYKRNFEVFKGLYSGLKDSMHEINLINS